MDKIPAKSGFSTKRNTAGAIPGFITQIAPFLLPALFFESGLLLAISPLPLFIVALKNHSWISLVALLTNTALLFAVQGKSVLPLAVWLWSIVGILFPILIRRFGKVLPGFWMCFAFGLSVFYIALSVIALQENMGVVQFVKNQVSFNIEALLQIPDSPLTKIVAEQGRPEIQRQIVDELPAAILIAYLSIFLLNLIFAARFIKGFLSRSFWGTYRNPEWLVWPTLMSGAAYAFGKMAIYYIGLNSFKLMLALYALQGLSIISFLLTKYKIFGLGRIFILFTSVFILMPFVLALGFFDLWFDFRKKFGQSL